MLVRTLLAFVLVWMVAAVAAAFVCVSNETLYALKKKWPQRTLPIFAIRQEQNNKEEEEEALILRQLDVC